MSQGLQFQCCNKEHMGVIIYDKQYSFNKKVVCGFFLLKSNNIGELINQTP